MKHKYLEDIGIHEYVDNNYGGYSSIKDFFRSIKHRLYKHRVGVDPRDSWSLDNSFYYWLYEHLCQYIKDASGIVDLEYYRFEYDGKNWTQLEFIEYLKSLVVELIQFDCTKDCINMDSHTVNSSKLDGNHKYYESLRKQICEIWGILLPYMWY